MTDINSRLQPYGKKTKRAPPPAADEMNAVRWIPWTGAPESPMVNCKVLVEVRSRNGETRTGDHGEFDWSHSDGSPDNDVVEYRLV